MNSELHRWISFAAIACVGGCAAESEFRPRVHEGNAERGREALARHECGVCHLIPGVPGAVGRVGPTLDAFARHPYIAGKLPNEPERLVRFLVDAPALAPQTAMPAMAMSDQEARDVAAYLYELD